MNELYGKTKELFEKELEKIVKKGDVGSNELEYAYKIVDIIKDIGEICEQEDSYMDEYSGRRGMYRSRNNYSIRGSYAGGNGYSNRGYSRNGSLMANLQSMLNEAGSDHERMMIQNWIDEMMN